MATKTNVPTNDELQQQLRDAQERLRVTRLGVANGTADSAQLAEAEQVLRFAQTRIEAAGEARQEAARHREAERIAGFAKTLDSLEPIIDKQRERAEQIRELMADYLDEARGIEQTIGSLHWELEDYRNRHRKMPDGFRTGPMSTSIVANGKTYSAPNGIQQLRQLVSEAEASGRVGRKKAG